MKLVGKTVLNVNNPKSNTVHATNCIVVKNDFNCLLDLSTIQELNFITVNDNCFIANLDTTSDLGDLGTLNLEVVEDVRPKILPSRKISLGLQDIVKQELDNLVKRNVISLVNEPTEWVSQMAVVKKSNGDLHTCIDPQPLNAALQREHFKLPIVHDVLPKLNNAKVFTKLDVKQAYWRVKLYKQLIKLTTVITFYLFTIIIFLL